ncbi:MAG: HIRAN domain-containing protein [Clostridia bacterium]|nr:HIRAN domain-containing protein [Clostridia bacterium]
MMYRNDDNVHYLFSALVVGSFFTENINEGAKASEIGDEITLKRERYNKFDKKAVAVYNHRGIKLGYITRHQNTAVANIMDSGMVSECFGIIQSLDKRRTSVGMLASIYYVCEEKDYIKIIYIIQRS